MSLIEGGDGSAKMNALQVAAILVMLSRVADVAMSCQKECFTKVVSSLLLTMLDRIQLLCAVYCS